MYQLGTVCLIEVEEEDIELDLDAIVPITDDLTTEFKEQPSLYAYIAILAARAEALLLDAKSYKEELYAKTDKEVRKDLSLAGEKITEPRVKQEIQLCRGYVEAIEYEIEIHEQYLIMKALTRTMDMRAQMLISLGAHLRTEAEQTGMLINQTKKAIEDIRKVRKPVKFSNPKKLMDLDEEYDDEAAKRGF